MSAQDVLDAQVLQRRQIVAQRLCVTQIADQYVGLLAGQETDESHSLTPQAQYHDLFARQ
jgi:hypothetical protein